MPFGAVDIQLAGRSKPLKIDFNRIYRDLIVPALQKADCEPFRADSQISAGDIRTDMLFELVTADVVVADLSIPNPNVYYELGIRDGVCARRVLIIQGGWSVSQPFDVAQDRCFKYDGMLFSLDGIAAEPPAEHAKAPSSGAPWLFPAWPPTAATAVGNRIDEVLDAWKIGKGDLAICGGSTEGDVMFAEKCLAREAQVRLLILEPTALQLAEVFSDPVSSEWATRSSSLHCLRMQRAFTTVSTASSMCHR